MKKIEGLVAAGDSKLLTRLAKAPTAADHKLLDSAVLIRQEPPSAEDLAFMARELVLCTLPHSDPGQVPYWNRRNGNVILSLQSAYDPETDQLVGYPYGSIPRLVLFWMTTEALRTGSRRLSLGSSYSGFLRDIGLNPSTGRGKRGDAARVRNQTRRLITSTISFIETREIEGVRGEARKDMRVASDQMLWWDPKRPDQLNLWESWLELGEKFYEAITAAPVPVDLRALSALKRSPLALDLYAWATHRALSVSRKGRSDFIPWKALAQQFGADYTNHHNFKTKAKAAFRKILTVYPGLKLGDQSGGIIVLATSSPAIAARSARRS